MSNSTSSTSKSDSELNLCHDNDEETMPKRLKGSELLDYIEVHQSIGNDNGDSLCIEAGYGTFNKDGTATCRLDLFSTELIKAKKESHTLNSQKKARQHILKTYDFKTLKIISERGCLSGKAHAHLQISEDEKFFDKYSDEIKVTLEDHFGSNYLSIIEERALINDSHWKHRAVWRFIEIIANDEMALKNQKGI